MPSYARNRSGNRSNSEPKMENFTVGFYQRSCHLKLLKQEHYTDSLKNALKIITYLYFDLLHMYYQVFTARPSANAAYRAHMDGVATNLTYANVRQTGGRKEIVPRILDLALTAAPLEGHARTGPIHASANQVGACVLMVSQKSCVTLLQ